MRILVRCVQCERRYDASAKPIGSQFHCHCGEVLIVKQPRSHQSRVIRCSACGAPRQSSPRGAAGPSCAHCGADFTLHEQDLNTVCPSCLTRVSDRSRFCHHCAAPLAADEVAGRRTKKHCPACGTAKPVHLVSRKLGGHGFSALECPKCGGLWLAIASLEHLLDLLGSKQFSRPKHARSAAGAAGGGGYRPCVECGQLMVRRNLSSGRSGVVVDLCGAHGIWFDKDELADYLAFLKADGVEEARREVASLIGSRNETGKKAGRPVRQPAAPPSGAPRVQGTDQRRGTTVYEEVALQIPELLLRLFLR